MEISLLYRPCLVCVASDDPDNGGGSGSGGEIFANSIIHKLGRQRLSFCVV